MWPQRASPLPSALARRIERCRWERATTRRRRRPRRPSDAYMFSPSLHLSPASLLPSAVFLLRVSACVPLPVWRPRPSLATPVARRSVGWSVGRSLPRLSLAQTDLCKWEMEPLPPQPPTAAAMMMMICSPCVVLGSRWPPSAEAASCGRKAVALELLQWRDLQTDGRRQSVCACACVGDLGLEALSSERPSNIFCPSSHRGRIPRGKGN